MDDDRAPDAALDQDLIAEAEAVTAVRRAREEASTPAERVERLHALCAQLATFAAATRREPA